MNIVVCVDQNNASRFAVREATKFADVVDGNLTLVHSVQETVQEDGSGGIMTEGNGNAIDRSSAIVERLVDKSREMSDGSCEIDYKILSSSERHVDDILSYAEEIDADHIFLGHRKLDQKHEELFGSFAKEMIGSSKIPVTVVTE